MPVLKLHLIFFIDQNRCSLRLVNSIAKQMCLLCGEKANFCICSNCEEQFESSKNRCISCAYPLTNNLNYCGECLTQAPIFDKTYALYDYDGFVAYLIKQFKYGAKLSIGNFFAYKIKAALQAIVESGSNYDAIIPMPLSSFRLRERGFNQTTELLRHIDDKSIIDIKSCQRIKATRALASLNHKERRKEIKGAFAIRRPILHKKILLVDDIMTTGSSLNELAKTIIKHTKVNSCDALVLARA